MFLERGYADASIDLIAAEAGVSKQTIYNNFEGKERLFAAVVQTVQHTVATGPEGTFAERFEVTGDFDRDLRAAFRMMTRLNLSEDIAAFRRLVITEQIRHPELMREWRQPRPALELALTQEIERQTGLGTVDVDDPGLAARQLIILIFNEAVERSQYGLRELPEHEIATIVDDGVDMWMRCYRRDPMRR
ncbi:TetR/AcrR family transcriptional regulator [Actinomadura alba]